MKLLKTSAIACLLGISLQTEAAWKNFRADAQNTGSFDLNIKSMKTGVEKVSVFDTTGLIWATAVTDDQGNIYVGSADKFLYALNPQGELRWKYKVYDNADALIDSASLVAENNLLVIPGGDGYLHAVDRTTGKFVWDFKASGVDDDDHASGVIVNSFEGNVTQGPDGTIYAGSDNGYMYAVDLKGKLKWKFKTGMMIWSSPAFDPQGKWMVFGSLDKKVYLLDTKTGKMLDKIKVGAEVKASPLVLTDGGKKSVFFGDANGRLFRYDIKEKKKKTKFKRRWKFKTKKEIYASATSFQDNILVGSRNGQFYSVDKNTGKLVWKYDTLSVLAGSPIISRDGVVLFGARNGKIYALDALSGVRLWSFKTAKGNLKVNLDASPIVTQKGIIYNGSYSGKFYGVPVDYCFNNKDDERCEFSGKVDLLAFVERLDDGVHFLFQDRQGVLHQNVPKTLNAFESLRLKLVVKEKGKYIKNAGIWHRGLKIESTSGLDFKISSDSHFLNIVPSKGFTPGEKVVVSVKGKYFKRTNWFVDRLKHLATKKFESQIVFNAQDFDIATSDTLKRWESEERSLGIRNMFLFQPISLETYIPAALDGQYFVIKHLGTAKDGNTFFALALPSQKVGDVYSVMPWVNKAFILKGDSKGNAIRLQGAFEMAAMGGSIPFKEATFSAVLGESKATEQGQLVTVSPCMKIKGNGSSFQFPLSVIDDTCDHKLNLIAVGKFEGDWAKTASIQFSQVDADNFQNTGDKTILITVVSKNISGEVVGELKSLKLEAGESININEIANASDQNSYMVFFNEKLVKIVK